MKREWTGSYCGVSHCPAKSKLSDRRVSVDERETFTILHKMPADCGFMRQSELDKAEKGQFKEDAVGWIEEIYDTVEEAKREGEKWLKRC